MSAPLPDPANTGAAREAVRPGLTRPGPPLWLLLELTYRCPLHCAFCYNPTDFARTGPELATEDWLRVLREARALGAVQLGLSGGEPLSRDDLEPIVAEAHRLGFYTNLITSGVGLTETRIQALKTAGLDHIQLSFQDSTRQMNDFLSSTRTFDLKSKVAALIKQYDYPMVLNVVLHRLNIDHVEEILADGRAHGRGLRRAREYAVLRLGVAQPRAADAEPRAGRARGGGDAALPRARGSAHADLLRGAGLLRAPPEGLHERARVAVSHRDTRRHRAALSRCAHACRASNSRTWRARASSTSGTNRPASSIFAAMRG